MGEGRFVVLEGIDGCGSTTQAARLVAALRARGVDARRTAEPTSGPVGRLIREGLGAHLIAEAGESRATFDWATFALLFAADRVDHNETVIGPALAKGAWVVSDRYDLSSLAYQSATAVGAEASVPWIRELNRRARRPDLTIVLDVDPAVASERRRRRGGQQEIYEVDAVQQRLATIYARAQDLVPNDRVVHVASEGPVESVARTVLAAVDPLLIGREGR
ncbi:MAG: dTMP kinase [Polyangiaceae bacterium]|nr:dTMP kinase [Polyangiaceae bacterium]